MSPHHLGAGCLRALRFPDATLAPCSRSSDGNTQFLPPECNGTTVVRVKWDIRKLRTRRPRASWFLTRKALPSCTRERFSSGPHILGRYRVDTGRSSTSRSTTAARTLPGFRSWLRISRASTRPGLRLSSGRRCGARRIDGAASGATSADEDADRLSPRAIRRSGITSDDDSYPPLSERSRGPPTGRRPAGGATRFWTTDFANG